MKKFVPTTSQLKVLTQNFNLGEGVRAFAYLGNGLFLMHGIGSDYERCNLVKITGENDWDFINFVPNRLNLNSPLLDEDKEVQLARAAYRIAYDGKRIHEYSAKQQEYLKRIQFFSEVYFVKGRLEKYFEGCSLPVY